MSGFEVQPAELLAVQSAVADAAAGARAELARLAASAQDLLGPGWQGAAATAFGRGFDQWHAGARSVLAALDEIGAALGATARTYATAEDATTGLAS